jgi:hypothetical protein
MCLKAFKLGMVEGNFKRANFPFCPNFKFSIDLEF